MVGGRPGSPQSGCGVGRILLLGGSDLALQLGESAYIEVRIPIVAGTLKKGEV